MTKALIRATRSFDIKDSGILSGHRNKIINGNFDVWQRGSVQVTSGIGSVDRWGQDGNGSKITATQQSFNLGQTAVPGNPKYFLRSAVTSVTGASNYRKVDHKIEGVDTLAGKKVTITFYAKANAVVMVAIELIQFFGSGGSSLISGIGVEKFVLTTEWQKFTKVVELPSISGKILGTNNDYLALSFWFDSGTDYSSRNDSIGHQSGVFDIARVSLVEGDATQEDDPFSPRHPQQELALCQRYFYAPDFDLSCTTDHAGNLARARMDFNTTMRVTPSAVGWTSSAGSLSMAASRGQINFAVSGVAVGSGILVFSGTLDAEL